MPRDEVMEVAAKTGATPYDVPGVELGHRDDHDTLMHGTVTYDALYAWCRQ